MQNITEDQISELQKLVKAAARRVAGQWPVTVEKDDLEQDMLTHLLGRPGSLQRLFEEPEQQVRQSFLIKMGHQLASEQQQQYDRFSGNYLYDSAEVRGYLERQIWLQDDLQSSAKLDLSEALGLLADKNSGHYAAVINRFVHELQPDRDDTGAFKMIQRAVDSLTELMNRIGAERRRHHVEGPGSRKAMSNAAAAAIGSNAWQGDVSEIAGRH